MIRYLLFAPFALVIAFTAMAVDTPDAYIAGIIGSAGVWALMFGIIEWRKQQ